MLRFFHILRLLHLFVNSSPPFCENMSLGQRCRHSERSRTIAPGPSAECILSPSTLLRINSVEGLRVTQGRRTSEQMYYCMTSKRHFFKILLLLAVCSLLIFGGYLWRFRQDSPPIQAERLELAISLGRQYLIKACDADGKFVYRVNLNPTVHPKPKYNMLRHAGTMYALAQYETHRPEQTTRDSLKRAAGFLRRTIRPLPDSPDLLAVWSLPEITGSKNGIQLKLGGTGLGLVALLSVEHILPGTTPLEDLRRLGRFLVFMQKEDGSFYAKYFPEKGARNDAWISLYYPGEAALGLLLLYEHDPDPLWLRTALQAITYLAQKRSHQPLVEADHWILLATAKLFSFQHKLDQVFPQDLFLRHAVQICESILAQRVQLEPGSAQYGCFSDDGLTSPTATRLEGLLTALTFLPSQSADLRERITTAVHLGVGFLLSSQIKAGPYPGGITRAIRRLPISHPKFSSSFNRRATEIRIDYVQHAISALLHYQQMFL